MNKHWKCVGGLARKDGKVLLRSLPALALLLALLCTGCVCLCMTVLESVQTAGEKLVVGIVDKDGSMAGELASSLVSGNEQVGMQFDVAEFETPEQAYGAVARRETIAAIIFEPEYLQKLKRGEPSAVSVVLSQETELYAQLVVHFADTGETLLKTSEYAADAARDPIRQVYPGGLDNLVKFSFYTTKFGTELMSLTGKAVDGVVLPYSDRAGSVEGHYILYYSVLLLTLLDMLFFDFVRRDNSRTLLTRLKSLGVGSAHILLGKLPFFLLAKGLVVAAVLGVMGLFVPVSLTPLTILGALCAVVFSSVSGVALCALLQRSNVGPCILCALAFAGLFLCGGLIPYDQLPEAVTACGQFTHVGVTAAMLSPILGGTVTVWHYVTALLFLAALGLGSWFYMEQLRQKGSDAV